MAAALTNAATDAMVAMEESIFREGGQRIEEVEVEEGGNEELKRSRNGAERNFASLLNGNEERWKSCTLANQIERQARLLVASRGAMQDEKR